MYPVDITWPHWVLAAATSRITLFPASAMYKFPEWSTDTQAVAAPKLVLTDSGLAAHLTGVSLRRARHPTAPVGPLIETFVLGELACQLTFTDQPARLCHYRDRDRYEVDPYFSPHRAKSSPSR